MKNPGSLHFLYILCFILIFSCSTEEDTTVETPNIVQAPDPEPVAETPTITQYTLTISAGEGGTVSIDGGTYDEGTEVSITATANEGYRFTGWEGNDSTNESLTITLNSDQTLQAQFELIPIYTLTVITSEGGALSIESGEYQEGTEVSITATANEGYRFDGWEGYDSNENTITLNISSDTELTPIFNIANLSPTNYGVDEYWGKIVEFEPDIIFADDIPGLNREGLLGTINLAIEYYGNYGPTEWYIIGDNKDNYSSLGKIFADRRLERNQINEDEYELNRQDIINDFNTSPVGLYGRRGDGYHLVLWKIDLNPEWYFPVDTTVHEYTHIVQSANLFTKDEEDRPDGDRRRIGWGPIFFSEGTAVYYAEYIPRILANQGKTIDWPPLNNRVSLNDKMKEFMLEDIQPNLDSCPDFNIWEVNYSTRETCSPYRFGAWGVAYLLDKVNDQDAFWKTLWPNVDEMGWDGAFEYTFGITMEQFNQEFLEFLELPIEQQLEIIPDI